MNDVFFTIIIKDTNNLSAVDALKRQNWTDYECFITNNHIMDLEKYLAGDNRFHIIDIKSDDAYKNINTAIERGMGKYFIIINSDDILISNALVDISRIAKLTNSPIIKYNTAHNKNVFNNISEEQQRLFNYLIRRDMIMEYAFDNLSAFCFARDFIKTKKIYAPEHVCIMNMLKETPALTKTDNAYLLHLTEHNKHTSVEYAKIIDNYKKIKNEFGEKFWCDYFAKIIPDLIKTTISEQRKDIFVYCCKNIPLKFIPLKYKFMFFIMKITSKQPDISCI